MAKAFADLAASDEATSLSHAEWLALLLDHEATWRNDRRLALRLRQAHLRHHAAPEDVDYRAPRGLDRRLFDTLLKGDGRIAARMKSLARVDLLILDDWGLEPLDGNARHHLLQVLEDRYGQRSTLVTSQLPIARWHELIGDPTYADAILDRLVHNAHRLEMSGDSLRRPTALVAA